MSRESPEFPATIRLVCREHLQNVRKTAGLLRLCLQMMPMDMPLKISYTNNGFAIAATCQNPERTLAAMDLIMNDPRYNTLLQYGIEGETYIINEEGKVDYPEGVTADTTSYNWENTGFWFINKNHSAAPCILDGRLYRTE